MSGLGHGLFYLVWMSSGLVSEAPYFPSDGVDMRSSLSCGLPCEFKILKYLVFIYRLTHLTHLGLSTGLVYGLTNIFRYTSIKRWDFVNIFLNLTWLTLFRILFRSIYMLRIPSENDSGIKCNSVSSKFKMTHNLNL